MPMKHSMELDSIETGYLLNLLYVREQSINEHEIEKLKINKLLIDKLEYVEDMITILNMNNDDII